MIRVSSVIYILLNDFTPYSIGYLVIITSHSLSTCEIFLKLLVYLYIHIQYTYNIWSKG